MNCMKGRIGMRSHNINIDIINNSNNRSNSMSSGNVALVATRPGAPLEVLRLESGKSGGEDGEVRVRVLSAGLAFPDLLTIQDRHVFKRKFPFVAGGEMAGVVISCRSGKFKPGDVVFGGCYGAIQSEVVISEESAYLMPKRVSPHIVSGFEMNYGTTWHGLVDQAKIQKGEWLLVLGASGGVGLAACDIGRALGARVIACASSDEKLKGCLEGGAEFAVNYSDPDKFRAQIEDITGGKSSEAGGVDVVYDAVGGVHSELAIRMLKFGGRHLVIGFASGGNNPQAGIPKIPLNLCLLNERVIMGVLYGGWRVRNPEANRKMIEHMLSMIEEGKLKPLVKVYPIAKWQDAFRDIIERRSVGKVVISLTDDLATTVTPGKSKL